MIFRASECYNLIGRARRKEPDLTDAGKKYVRKKWLEHEKLFRPPFRAKELVKGIAMEEDAMDFYSEFLGTPLVKCYETKHHTD